MIGTIVCVSALLPSQHPISNGKPCRSTSRPTMICGSTRRSLELCRRRHNSKERRVDPQIIVGLLVDRHGFPLEIGCWEGNKAETHTIVPIIEAFAARHEIEDLVVVADAGMRAVGCQFEGPGSGRVLCR